MRPFIKPSTAIPIIEAKKETELERYTMIAKEIEDLMAKHQVKNYEIQAIISVYSNRRVQRMQNFPVAEELTIMKDYDYAKPDLTEKPPLDNA